MHFDPQRHHRHSIRLKGYDYSLAGAYFITACTQEREPLFGEVVGGEMILTAAGDIVLQTWDGLPGRFPSVDLDICVVMPNHIHAILLLTNSPTVGAPLAAPLPVANKGAASSAILPRAPTLGEIMRAFKSISAIAINRQLGCAGQPVWQRDYHDRIIRNEREYEAIAAYVFNNPAQWECDRENPARILTGSV